MGKLINLTLENEQNCNQFLKRYKTYAEATLQGIFSRIDFGRNLTIDQARRVIGFLFEHGEYSLLSTLVRSSNYNEFDVRAIVKEPMMIAIEKNQPNKAVNRLLEALCRDNPPEGLYDYYEIAYKVGNIGIKEYILGIFDVYKRHQENLKLVKRFLEGAYNNSSTGMLEEVLNVIHNGRGFGNFPKYREYLSDFYVEVITNPKDESLTRVIFEVIKGKTCVPRREILKKINIVSVIEEDQVNFLRNLHELEILDVHKIVMEDGTMRGNHVKGLEVAYNSNSLGSLRFFIEQGVGYRGNSRDIDSFLRRAREDRKDEIAELILLYGYGGRIESFFYGPHERDAFDALRWSVKRNNPVLVKRLCDYGVKADRASSAKILELYSKAVVGNETSSISDVWFRVMVDGDIASIHKMIELGVDVTMVDSAGQTALHYTTNQGNILTSQLLLVSGIDARIQDSNGLTAQDIAVSQGDESMQNMFDSYYLDSEFVRYNKSFLEGFIKSFLDRIYGESRYDFGEYLNIFTRIISISATSRNFEEFAYRSFYSAIIDITRVLIKRYNDGNSYGLDKLPSLSAVLYEIANSPNYMEATRVLATTLASNMLGSVSGDLLAKQWVSFYRNTYDRNPYIVSLKSLIKTQDILTQNTDTRRKKIPDLYFILTEDEYEKVKLCQDLIKRYGQNPNDNNLESLECFIVEVQALALQKIADSKYITAEKLNQTWFFSNILEPVIGNICPEQSPNQMSVHYFKYVQKAKEYINIECLAKHYIISKFKRKKVSGKDFDSQVAVILDIIYSNKISVKPYEISELTIMRAIQSGINKGKEELDLGNPKPIELFLTRRDYKRVKSLLNSDSLIDQSFITSLSMLINKHKKREERKIVENKLTYEEDELVEILALSLQNIAESVYIGTKASDKNFIFPDEKYVRKAFEYITIENLVTLDVMQQYEDGERESYDKKNILEIILECTELVQDKSKFERSSSISFTPKDLIQEIERCKYREIPVKLTISEATLHRAIISGHRKGIGARKGKERDDQIPTNGLLESLIQRKDYKRVKSLIEIKASIGQSFIDSLFEKIEEDRVSTDKTINNLRYKLLYEEENLVEILALSLQKIAGLKDAIKSQQTWLFSSVLEPIIGNICPELEPEPFQEDVRLISSNAIYIKKALEYIAIENLAKSYVIDKLKNKKPEDRQVFNSIVAEIFSIVLKRTKSIENHETHQIGMPLIVSENRGKGRRRRYIKLVPKSIREIINNNSNRIPGKLEISESVIRKAIESGVNKGGISKGRDEIVMQRSEIKSGLFIEQSFITALFQKIKECNKDTREEGDLLESLALSLQKIAGLEYKIEQAQSSLIWFFDDATYVQKALEYIAIENLAKSYVMGEFRNEKLEDRQVYDSIVENILDIVFESTKPIVNEEPQQIELPLEDSENQLFTSSKYSAFTEAFSDFGGMHSRSKYRVFTSQSLRAEISNYNNVMPEQLKISESVIRRAIESGVNKRKDGVAIQPSEIKASLSPTAVEVGINTTLASDATAAVITATAVSRVRSNLQRRGGGALAHG